MCEYADRWMGADYILNDHSSSEGLLGDDIVELFLRHQPVVVGICPFDHFLQLRLVDCFAQLLRHSPQILN